MESYVTDGKNACFVPQFDVEALKKELKTLLADDAMRKELGRNARAYAVQYLNAELFAEKLAMYLKEFSPSNS